ncbi:MAG: TraR/DksA C4-type zinc finger protein [SAR86 cluster bacterium]|jgi:DnaK suppressor protein|nr:TraR/DksA C4-type zinc finger protein [SAR86 cluster bacterium]
MLTKEKILKAPKKNYMNKDQLVFFHSLLNDLKQETLTHIREAKDRLSNPPSCSDEVDRAQHEIDSMLFLRIVERESKLLPKIDKAIMRIKAGDYGFCLETGEPIGLERLISRPTAEYCAEVKTINEEKEKHYVD